MGTGGIRYGVRRAVTGGFGAWRLRAVYEDEFDEDNDLQRIAFGQSVTLIAGCF